MKSGKLEKRKSRLQWGVIAVIRGGFWITAMFLMITFLLLADKTNSEIGINETFDWTSEEISSWMSRMSERMTNRRKHLKIACERARSLPFKYEALERANSSEFLVNRKHRLIWCYVFRDASSSWVYNFNLLAGYSKSFLNQANNVPLILARSMYPYYSLHQLKRAQNDSTTFLIARHPFERLLSAYRGLVLNAAPLTPRQQFNIKLLKMFRNTSVSENPPMFSEFVSYVIKEFTSGRKLNMHWKPITEICTPCQINFDVIMKFETLDEDQHYLIHKQGLDRWLHPQWKHASEKGTKSVSFIEKFYLHLTKQQIDILHRIYRYDFLLFNYSTAGFMKN